MTQPDNNATAIIDSTATLQLPYRASGLVYAPISSTGSTAAHTLTEGPPWHDPSCDSHTQVLSLNISRILSVYKASFALRSWDDEPLCMPWAPITVSLDPCVVEQDFMATILASGV